MNFLLRLLCQVPALLTGFVHSLLPCTPRSSTPIDFSSSSASLVIRSHSVQLPEESGLGRDRRLVTIDVLPDDVLVEIFSHVNLNTHSDYFRRNILGWHVLVHVCRRWRYLVFASPRHLNIRHEYSAHRPMSEMLDVWPSLPVTITSGGFGGEGDQQSDNMLAALESEHSNRICVLGIYRMVESRWERFAAAMQKPFPELTNLEIFGPDFCHVVPALPDSFLGGSAPRLRTLRLRSIPLPSIPKLLLSANGLVKLDVWDIPDSGYFSPDGLATALTAMTRLETISIEFHSPRPRPDPASRPLPPPTRFVLPALAVIGFKGDSEYLEVLLARIDAPRLNHFSIKFFMGLNFDVSQLHRLIRHAEVFNTIDYAEALLCGRAVHLYLYPNTAAVNPRRRSGLVIDCRELNGQLSSLAQVCRSFTPLISTLEVFKIREEACLRAWKDDIEDTRWLNLLGPFTGLKNLYLTYTVARHVCGALQNLSGQRATEVLPALRNLFLPAYSSSQSVQATMTPFVAARQLVGHPVVIGRWEGDFA